ncbi:hypothetical protein LJB99_00700 [Deltaproteobacteria bacterium OttesenSCG-928-K17]|nr:hypothetical protein [Deltaproteobacteria bacterium OttesenSCG-928-K17]
MDNNHSNPKDQSGAAPMEQVREILFGAQLKDMEVRFKRQEDRLLREIHDVKDSLKKRLDSLENFMKSEVGSMLDRLKREQEEREAVQRAEQKERQEALAAEQRERAEAIKNEQREREEAFNREQRAREDAIKAEAKERHDGLTRLTGDLIGAEETFERKLAKLADTIDTAERDLRSLLLSEGGSLTDKIESKYADALGVVAKTAAQIRSDMVYRTAISGMFAEMIGGLSKPWHEENMGLMSQDDDEENNADASYEAQVQSGVSEDDAEDEDDLPQVARIGSADNY